MSTQTVEECVELAVRGGCTVIQLREKKLTTREFYHTAQNVLKITRKYNVPLIINDRADIAMAVGADGVHVGQKDLPANVVRKMLGPDKIIGVSCATPEEAVKAAADSADYLGAGAVFPTGTKSDTRPVTRDTLIKITGSVSIPVVAIGGVNRLTAPGLRGTGIKGLAVVSAVAAQPDISAAAAEMLKIYKNL